MSLFLKAPESYVRDIDIMSNYNKNLSAYISVMKDLPYEEALKQTIQLTKEGGPLEPKIPTINALTRKHTHADKVKSVIPFDRLIKNVTDNNRIISPSLIVYESPEVDQCYQAEFIDAGLERRAKVKNLAHQAKADGNSFLAYFHGKSQVNIKTLNNSFSGANCSPHNPNFAKSTHTSLTSTTRTATSNSNSSTERFMGGNRHYYSFDIAIENMAAAIRLTDETKIVEAMQTYNLVYPTTEYVVGRIKESCSRYWNSREDWVKVESFIRKMSPIQLISVIGTGDLWTWIHTNPEFVRKMFSDLMILDGDVPQLDLEEAKKWAKGADSYIESLAKFLMSDYDFNKKDPDAVVKVFGAFVKVLSDRITKDYMDFFEAFFITDLTPHSVHFFPTSIREVVIASDTDSTLFTTQKIIEWYCGKLEFNTHANKARELITYLNSQIICHILAKVSKNMGVPNNKLFNIMMKPEYSMPVMGVTNRAKHYFATESACEGKIYPEPELVTKGVGLKSSKVPKWIINIFNDYVSEITEIFQKGEKITAVQAISVPAYLEHKIINDLEAGRSEALYNARIKDAAAYKNPMQSNYLYYDLWEEVFAPKYGTMGEPTIEAKKVPVDIPNKTAMDAWLRSIEKFDSAMADRLRTWLDQNGKKNFTMILVPQIFLLSNPIPKEIWMAVNLPKLLKDLTESFYYILEILGIYYKNKNLTRFCYNDIPMDVAKENLLIDLTHLE